MGERANPDHLSLGWRMSRACVSFFCEYDRLRNPATGPAHRRVELEAFGKAFIPLGKHSVDLWPIVDRNVAGAFACLGSIGYFGRELHRVPFVAAALRLPLVCFVGATPPIRMLPSIGPRKHAHESPCICGCFSAPACCWRIYFCPFDVLPGGRGNERIDVCSELRSCVRISLVRGAAVLRTQHQRKLGVFCRFPQGGGIFRWLASESGQPMSLLQGRGLEDFLFGRSRRLGFPGGLEADFTQGQPSERGPTSVAYGPCVSHWMPFPRCERPGIAFRSWHIDAGNTTSTQEGVERELAV